MHKVIKIRYTLFYGELPEANSYGYMELNQDGNMIASTHRYVEKLACMADMNLLGYGHLANLMTKTDIIFIPC